MVVIPQLSFSGRDREYKQRSYDEISQITKAWLFTDDQGHRELDRDILGLDPLVSKGWQSMGVLHYLGLKKEFKGLFTDISVSEAIEYLESDEQDFAFVIELLQESQTDLQQAVIKALTEIGERKAVDFEANYQKRLSELSETDASGRNSTTRKEQGLLRALTFGDAQTMQCSLCHREFPCNLMVTAHIKPRSKCSPSERKDPNVVMPVCKIGCDDFYEKGYLLVEANGQIQTRLIGDLFSDVATILADYDGKRCLSHNEKTESYFRFKRDLMLT